MLLKRCAHRDLSANNIFFENGRIKLIDFETMGFYSKGNLPSFPQCYDVTGRGMQSPYRTCNMGYSVKRPRKDVVLESALKVPFKYVLKQMVKGLRQELKAASSAFKSEGGRHISRSGRIYSSFSLPHVNVSRKESQRDSAKRFKKIRVSGEMLSGKSILDLGSHVGGMLFEAQKYCPGRCVGVEHDIDKVRVARRIVAFNGLNNIIFIQKDIDELRATAFKGTFDVVFCFAIEKHLKEPGRLYELLSGICNDVLFFEGNQGTDVENVIGQLRENGFSTVESLGFSDDDCLPENNCRPLLVARKKK